MIAIKRLKNILWILIVAFGALTAYLISLRVATERNAVQALDGQIYHVRNDIRYLETEFESRANMRQLEKWNAQDYRYGAPQASQYLPDERALASLDGVKPNGETYVAPPVMMAMADVPQAAASTESPAPAQIREDDTALRVASAKVEAPIVTPEETHHKSAEPAKPAPVRTAQVTLRPVVAPVATAPSPVARKAARMALLDGQLLDNRTLRDLGAKAAAESGSKNH